MAEFEKLRFDESEVVEGLRKIYDEAVKVKDAMEDTGDEITDAMKEATKATDAYEREITETEKKVSKMAKSTKATSEETKAFKTELSNAAKDINILGVNVGNVIGQLQGKVRALKAVGVGLQGTTGLLKVFKVALISTGIGAIVVALGSLVAFLTKTQRGLDKVNIVLAAVGAAIDVVVDRLSKLGGAIIKVFQGDFKGAVQDAKDAVTGLTKELIAETRAVALLEVRSQKLRDAQRELNVEYAETRKRVKELNLIAEDTTKTEQQRADAAQEALRIERGLLEKRKELAQEDLDITKSKNELSESLNADLDAEAEKRVALAQIETESLELQTTLNNKLNTIKQQERAQREAAYKEFIAKQKELNDLLVKEVETLDKQVQAVDLIQLSAEERAKAELQIALDAIDRQVRLIESTAKAVKQEVDITGKAEKLKQQLREETARKIITLQNQQLEHLKASLNLEKTAIEGYGEDVQDTLERLQLNLPIPEPDPEAKVKVVGEFQGFLREIGDLWDDPDIQAGVAALGDAFNSVFEGLTAGIQSQIEDNQRWLDDIRSTREQIESELETELERQKEGRANNVDDKRKELAQLQAEEDRALREQQELKKKQLRLQLIQDGAAQVSNLVTATANIIKEFSAVPFVGIALAIAAVASMFAFFAKAKAQAKTASARAWKGGSLKELIGANRHSEDRYGVGEGHLIEGTGLRIGGNEYLVNAASASANRQFLDTFNRGAFDGIDLSALLGSPDLQMINGKFRRREQVLSNQKGVASSRMARELFQKAIQRQTTQLLEYWKGRPIVYTIREGDKVVTIKDRSVVEVRV